MDKQEELKLEDELYVMGFSKGLPLKARKKTIQRFLRKHKENTNLKDWINYVKRNKDGIRNAGAFLRSALENGWELPTI